MTGAMEKGVWRIGIAKLCPACIREMETEYIVRPTHEIVLDPAKDISEKGYCERCHEKSPMLRRRRYTMDAKTLKAKGLDDKWREYME